MDPRTEPAGLLPLVRGRYVGALAQIAKLVSIDSGSHPAGVNRVADWCEARFRADGWEGERRKPAPRQDSLALGAMAIGRRAGGLPTAAGVPTLDGLGPVGGAPHSPAEWLDTCSLVPRISLLAGLLVRLGSGR